jgi:DoxX-like family
MNVLLWILQVVLALHTAAGAAWKFSHSAEQTMPTLKAIPNGAWLAMSVLELLCAVILIAPVFSKRLGIFVPVAAAYIIVEMILFTVLHVRSGSNSYGSIGYWLVVAAVCAFIAYGRVALRPFVG